MVDGYGRNIHYLRISVTDRCNLRCSYCMPPEGVENFPQSEILTYDEIIPLVHILSDLGINRIRFTGGEPLMRKDLPSLIKEINKIEQIEFMGLTTNGIFLKDMAAPLYEAGIKGINISLDTTDPKRYKEITGFDHLNDALTGIESALNVPFQSVKINCVLHPDTHDEDWMGVLALGKKWPVAVRFIEYMPLAGENSRACLNFDTVFKLISRKFGTPKPVLSKDCGGPANYFKISGFKGNVGFIHGMSHCFCEDCNRIRLTAIGDLKLCLFYDMGISLKAYLRSGAGDDEIALQIQKAIAHKPMKHQGNILAAEKKGQGLEIQRANSMKRIGG